MSDSSPAGRCAAPLTTVHQITSQFICECGYRARQCDARHAGLCARVQSPSAIKYRTSFFAAEEMFASTATVYCPAEIILINFLPHTRRKSHISRTAATGASSDTNHHMGTSFIPSTSLRFAQFDLASSLETDFSRATDSVDSGIALYILEMRAVPPKCI